MMPEPTDVLDHRTDEPASEPVEEEETQAAKQGRITIRLSGYLYRVLLAVCKEEKMTKTEAIHRAIRHTYVKTQRADVAPERPRDPEGDQ